jgi:hypothetical protein
MARPDADGNPSIHRHLRNLGYVPPEFQGEGRVWEDPDELGYFWSSGPPKSGAKNMTPDALLRACNDIIPEHERAEITQAALLCHSGHQHNAERHRAAAGYDRL